MLPKISLITKPLSPTNMAENNANFSYNGNSPKENEMDWNSKYNKAPFFQAKINLELSFRRISGYFNINRK